MSSLQVNTTSKNLFSVSKWLKHQVLLDAQEMRACLEAVGSFSLYNVSSLELFEELEISQNLFLKTYQDYISALRAGEVPAPDRKIFSSVMTVDSSALYAQEIKPGKWMAKLANPVVQLQHHRFFASKLDHKIHPMVMSHESIHWGLQFSFPQIFFDGAKGSYMKTSDEALFPNTALFSKLLKWLRAYSVPTTFIYEGVKISTPIRLGKECFTWIHQHPQLQEQGIKVHVY
jgi:hypothetical protein